MGQETHLVGNTGKGVERKVHVHPFSTAGGEHTGLINLTHPLIQTEPSTVFFTNPTKGIAMNQAVTFGGAKLRATILHAGVNSGSADTGQDDAGDANKLTEAGQNFEATVGPGALVHNTSLGTFALVTAVDSDTVLSLDTDIMSSGNNYVINDIWPGTAVAGTWNFADSGKITITQGLNNDEATFTVDSAHIWNMQHFVSFTGKIDLDTYDPALNSIILEFGLDGVLVGNSIDLNDFIDTGNFAEQSFVIPKAELGLTTQNINSMRILITRSGGQRPTIKFDDLQWENTGTPFTFEPQINGTSVFHVEELVFTYKDNIDSVSTIDVSTAATAEAVTNKALDPDMILGLASLTNGWVITRTKAGKTLFSATIHDLGSHMAAGATVTELITAPDSSSTQVVMRAQFKRDLVLTGDPNDTITIQINDDMSGLERFTVSARGGLETNG